MKLLLKHLKEDITDESHDIKKYQKQSKQASGKEKLTLKNISKEELSHKKRIKKILKPDNVERMIRKCHGMK